MSAPPRITPADIAAAAASIGCSEAAIHAVLVVETGGAGGFLSDGSGRPRILFEAHVFHRETEGRFTADYPDISSPTWNRALYVGGAGEYARLARAQNLDRDAALRSASWGMFQIMGFNHELAGFPTIEGFVQAMYAGEPQHLAAFLKICEAFGCADELIREDWAGFARIYNGPGYAANRYDLKLAAAAAEARRNGVAAGALAPAGVVAVTRLLRIGQRGEEVRRLQAALNAAGARLAEDGIFGRATEIAVEQFQERSGLVVDGIAGPRTLAALGM